jgi:hypothetical protein
VDALRLVGVSDIADMLGVSRQRASVLCARKGFPDPVDRVAPIDDMTIAVISALFSQREGTLTFEEAVAALEAGAHRLGPGIKLWRLSAIVRWADSVGRTANLDGYAPGRERPDGS